MKKYILLTFGIVMCIAGTIHAQVDQRDQWMNKYWFYRWRLINDFMVVGEGPGKSLPAWARCGAPNGVSDAGNNWGQIVRPLVRNGILNWNADCLINLGWYIGVLASEYGLLKERTLPSDPTGHCMDETGMELKYAIEAAERLDDYGESDENVVDGLSPLSGTATNGFLIRDDIPANFIDTLPTNPLGNPEGYANYLSLNSGKTISHSNPNEYSYMSQVESSYQQAAEYGNSNFLDPSKDQYVSLAMGLAMVQKFCSPDDNYEGYYFQPAAWNILNNMINFMVNQPTIGGDDFTWSMLYRPYVSGFIGSDNPLSCDGSGACGDDLAPGFWCLAVKWLGTSPPSPLLHTCTNYGADEAALWAALHDGTNKFDPLMRGYYMPALLAACSNSFAGFPVYQYNKEDYNVDGGDQDKYTTQMLEQMAANWDYQILPLMHATMFATGTGGYKPTDFQYLLNDAPCYGPHNFGPQNSNSSGGENSYFNTAARTTWYYNNGFDNYEWSSKYRWIEPYDRGCNIGFGANSGINSDGLISYNQNTGDYNGLDYMLFYNLYLYNYGCSEAPQTGYENELTNYLSATYPMHPSGCPRISWTVGNSSSQKRNIGFRSIASTEHIESDGNVYEQAGEEIDLNPGFEADAGSQYEAQVEYLSDCISGGNSYESPFVQKKNMAVSNMPSQYTGNNFVKILPADSTLNKHEPLNIVKIYPNPFSNDLNIDIQSDIDHPFELSLMNMLGQIVSQQTITNTTDNPELTITLHYSELGNGCYTIIIKDGQNISQKKIIKY